MASKRRIAGIAAAAALVCGGGTYFMYPAAKTSKPSAAPTAPISVLVRSASHAIKPQQSSAGTPAKKALPDQDGKEFGPDQVAVTERFNNDDPTPDTGLLVPAADREEVEKIFKDFSQTGGICEVTVRESYLPARDDGINVSYDPVADTYGYISPKTGEPVTFPAQQTSNQSRCTTLDNVYGFALPMIALPFDKPDIYGFKSPRSVTFTLSNPSSIWDGNVPGNSMAVTLTCTRQKEANTITCSGAAVGPAPSTPAILQPAP
jgi:hypothetical protein